MSLPALLAILPQPSTATGKPAPATPHLTASVVPASKWQCHPSGEEAARSATPTKEPTHQKWKEENFLMGLKESCQETFCQDSNLDCITRQRYFEAHHPTFDQEGSHDLSGPLWEMITSVDLLDSEIYKIQEVSTGWKDLQYAKHALKSFPKGLQFFHPMSPLELPKVMGLKGVHHPNTLCQHMGLLFCPWHGKEGQNEGTVVNHLWPTHYKLGLGLLQMSLLPHNHFRGHMASWPRLQAPWHRRGRQEAWWWHLVLIRLIHPRPSSTPQAPNIWLCA